MKTGATLEIEEDNDPAAILEKINQARREKRTKDKLEMKRHEKADGESVKKVGKLNAILEDTIEIETDTNKRLEEDGKRIVELRDTQAGHRRRAKKAERKVHNETTILPVLPSLDFLHRDPVKHVDEYERDVAQSRKKSGHSGDAFTMMYDDSKKRKKSHKKKHDAVEIELEDLANTELDEKIDDATVLARKIKDLAIDTKALVGAQNKQLDGIEVDIDKANIIEIEASEEIGKATKKKKKRFLCCC